MIPKHIKKKIKAVLPQYVVPAKKIMQERGITSRNGKPYSDVYIMYVFAGARNNTDIESCILQAYRTKLQELQELKSLKAKI